MIVLEHPKLQCKWHLQHRVPQEIRAGGSSAKVVLRALKRYPLPDILEIAEPNCSISVIFGTLRSSY